MNIDEFRIPLKNGYSLYAKEVIVVNDTKQQHQEENLLPIVLIVVHGGPGLSNHMESFHGLKHITKFCNSIIFYDQLGCGQSDTPYPKSEDDEELYSLQYYINELNEVIQFIITKRISNNHTIHICLLGHSWGGQIVLEYLVSSLENNKNNVLAAIISNAPLDEKSYERKQQMIRDSLDDSLRNFLNNEEYEISNHGSVQSYIYNKLIGISDTNITAEMNGWNILDRLHTIQHSCLFIVGTDDTVPVEDYQTIEQYYNDKNNKNRTIIQSVVLDGADHGPFFGHLSEFYFNTIREFLYNVVIKKK